MEVPCLHCGSFFLPRNKNQQYCSKVSCQRARRRNWQKEKLQCDAEYREGQRISQKKWLRANPDYWKKYREKNPDKVKRNRLLQRIRNNTSSSSSTSPPPLIAKMYARNRNSGELSGHYWLVPEIAKMDAAKIYIHAISTSCKELQRWT
ncbi:MAG: hypothetical protein KKE17_12610 [Proteobacteria bacterium]|nr:hypothetical protein [Pseudomonadota bacterium]MBU1710838.1 hypothetical protein [Pseudomonadota bacterium]